MLVLISVVVLVPIAVPSFRLILLLILCYEVRIRRNIAIPRCILRERERERERGVDD